jgi:ribosome-associated toxin RatA of RatAB toxin-antitoxin module
MNGPGTEYSIIITVDGTQVPVSVNLIGKSFQDLGVKVVDSLKKIDDSLENHSRQNAAVALASQRYAAQMVAAIQNVADKIVAFQNQVVPALQNISDKFNTFGTTATRSVGGVNNSLTALAGSGIPILSSVASYANRASRVFAALGGNVPLIIALAAAVAGLGLVWGSINEASKAEVIIEQLNNSLKENGGAAGFSARELVNYADSLVPVTAQSKSAIIQGETILTRFTKIGHEVFPEATRAALDLAQKTGNLPQAFTLVGKALENPQRGLRGLVDIGVEFTAGQRKTLDEMVRMGDIAGYQAIILQALHEKVGGAAEAYANTLRGGIKIAREEFVLFEQEVGSRVLPALEDVGKAIVKSSGGWKQIQKDVKNFGDTLGQWLAEQIYKTAADFFHFESDIASIFASMDEFVGQWGDAVLDAVANVLKAFGKLPDYLGGNIFAKASEAVKGYRDDFHKHMVGVIADANASADSLKKSENDMIKAMNEHKKALQGDADVQAKHGETSDTVAEKQKKLADVLASYDRVLRSVFESEQATLLKSEEELSAKQLLFTAILRGTEAYNQQKKALENERAEQALLAPLRQKYNEITDKGNDAIAKATELYGAHSQQVKKIIADMQGAQQANLAMQAAVKENADEMQILGDWTDIVANNIKKLTARAQEWGHEIGQGLLSALQIERQYNQELDKTKAGFIDWQAQTQAVDQYGSGIADILAKYGLLSKATEEVEIQQEILQKTWNLDPVKDSGAIARITADVRAYHDELNSIKKDWANAEIERFIEQPFKDAESNILSSWQTTINNLIVDGHADFSSFWKDFERQAIQAVENWFIRFVQRILAAKALESSVTASSYAGGGGGGVYGAAFSAVGQYASGAGAAGGAAGGAGAGGLYQAAGGAFFSGSSFGSALMGNPMTSGGYGAGGAAAWGAVWVAVVYAVVHYVLSHATPRGQDVLSAVDGKLQTEGDSSWGPDAAQSVADAMGATVADNVNNFVRSINARIESTTQLTIGRYGRGPSSVHFVYYTDQYGHQLRAYFKDINQAIDFATVQAIKNANLAGVSPELKNAIKNSSAQTSQGLNDDIQVGVQALHDRLGSLGSQVYDTVKKFEDQIAAEEALGIATENTRKAEENALQSLRNQLLGIDSSVSDFLASLRSFQDGIAEVADNARQKVESQISAAQAKLDDLLAKGPGEFEGATGPNGKPIGNTEQQWQAAVDKLKQQIQEYLAQLDKIPQALSDQEINMAIFDSLYKYLEGNAKYAKQAHEYARLKVELEFEAIKAQLIALGKWEEFAGMFNDAYQAALHIADHGGSAGGGSGKKDDIKNLNQQLDDLAAGRLGPVSQAIRAINKQYEEEMKLAHGNSAAIARVNAERRIELDLLKKQAAKQTADFLSIGTDNVGIMPVGDLTGKINGISSAHDSYVKDTQDKADAAIQANRDLAKAGEMTTAQMRAANNAIRQHAKELENEADKEAAAAKALAIADAEKDFNKGINALAGIADPFGDIEDQAASLRAKLADLAKQAGYSADKIAEDEKKIAGAEAMAKQSAMFGLLDQLYGYLKDSPGYQNQIIKLKQQEVDLQFQILKAQLVAANMWDENADLWAAAHDAAMQAASTTDYLTQRQNEAAQAQQAAAEAAQQAAQELADTIQSIRDWYRDLKYGSLSPLTAGQQLSSAQSEYDALKPQALAHNVDALKKVQDIVTNYLNAAQSVYGSGLGYQLAWQNVQQFLDQITGFGGPSISQIFGGSSPFPGGQSAPAGSPSYSGGATISINTAGLIDSMERVKDAVEDLKDDFDDYREDEANNRIQDRNDMTQWRNMFQNGVVALQAIASNLRNSGR